MKTNVDESQTTPSKHSKAGFTAVEKEKRGSRTLVVRVRRRSPSSGLIEAHETEVIVEK